MSLTRRELLVGAMLGPGLARAATAEDERSGLRDVAQQHGRVYGCAVKSRILRTDKAFVAAARQEAGILVPEYELKRGTVQPEPGRYEYSGSDAILAFATSNGMLMRGHTLVWHYANPDWLIESLKQKPDERILTDYIREVAGRYKGKFHAWDVVNEAVEPQQYGPRGLRIDSPWYQAFSGTYIPMAYHAAREADPTALLYYSDYSVEMATRRCANRRIAVLDLLGRLVSSGTPIDAFGIHGHLKVYREPFEEEIFASFLKDVAAMGLKILITELDVADIGGPTDAAQRDADVASLVRRLLDVAFDNPAVQGVVTWDSRTAIRGCRTIPNTNGRMGNIRAVCLLIPT